MSSKVNSLEFKSGYSAYNKRNDEEVLLVAKCGDDFETVWIVDGEKGLYLEYEYNLTNPFYYGD